MSEVVLDASALLVLGRHLSLPVLTIDRAWERLDVGVEVRLLRS